MSRWIIIGNCQVFGIANSISSLARNIECHACDIWQYVRQMNDDDKYYLNNFDFAVISEEVKGWFPWDERLYPPHILLPSLSFSAFHPDCCYVHTDGAPLQGVVGPYHSLIAIAAYKEGIDPRKAAAFFNEDVYRRAHYFSLWSPQIEWLVAAFLNAGMQIAPALRRLSREGSFMFTINHPKIGFLFEIAKAILTARNEDMLEGSWPPPETLAATQWPIYPEVGRSLGLAGSYVFKAANDLRPMELGEFLEQSHEGYARFDKSELVIDEHIRPRIRRIRQMMRNTG